MQSGGPQKQVVTIIRNALLGNSESKALRAVRSSIDTLL